MTDAGETLAWPEAPACACSMQGKQITTPRPTEKYDLSLLWGELIDGTLKRGHEVSFCQVLFYFG